jgi:hypothetical protein
MLRIHRFLALALLAFLIVETPPCEAAAPQINTLSLRGLQTGATTTLILEGSDLLPEPHLLLPVPIASEAIKQGATPRRIEIEIMLSDTVSPGHYPIRLANTKGVSNPVVIGIDNLAQVPFTPHIASLPAALHGKLPSSTTLKTTFSGKKGQRIVIDLEARRLGAVIDPVVELSDPRHVQLAYSEGQAFLGGDARIDTVLPVEGTFTVELHDILYRAGDPNHFRLKVGELYYADRVFPFGGQRGTEAWFELLGRVPPAAQRLKMNLHSTLADYPVPLPPIPGLSGTAPRILLDDFPEILEAQPADGKLQEVAVPAVINGRISKPGEEDRYRLLVKPGMKLRFDVLANRTGSPLDGVLVVRNERGAQLAMSDDRPETIDPGLDFTVPDGVTSLIVGLTDLQGRGGSAYLYRLAITPADRPDFGLTLFEDRQLIPRGGSAVVRIRANRTAYQGPIKLVLPGLPPEVTVSGDEIPSGATDTLLSLSAPAHGRSEAVLTQIVGTSSEKGTAPLRREGQSPFPADDLRTPIRRLALFRETPITGLQPGLRSDLAVAVTEPAPVQVAWENSDVPLAIGTRYPAPLHVARAKGIAGPIRFSLLTSQIVPKTSDGKREDPNRALRIESSFLMAADQTVGVAPILVPADLPLGVYDLAIRAELLGADGKSMLGTALTPSRRLRARPPFALQLPGPAVLSAKSGSTVTGKLKGSVLRVSGFTGAVTVTLAGLPDGVSAPTVTVAEGQSDFELSLTLSSNTKLEALLAIKVVATSSLGPQRVLKAQEVPLSLQFTP